MARHSGGARGAAAASRKEGNDRFQQRDWKGAVASYDRAIGFLLGSSSARLLLPAALQGEEREEFIKCATNRAIAWYKLEDYARCAADCSAVLDLDHGHGKARFRRACARKASGDWAGAREDLQACLAQGCSPGECRQLLQEIEDAAVQQQPPQPGKGRQEVVRSGPANHVVRLGFSSSSSSSSSSSGNGAGSISSSNGKAAAGADAEPPFHPAIQHVAPSIPMPIPWTTANPPPLTSTPSFGKNPDPPASKPPSSRCPVRYRPGRRRQALDVRRLLRQVQQAGPEPGDTFVVLPAGWWRAWQKYVGWGQEGTDAKEEQGLADSNHGGNEEGEEPEDLTLPPPPPPINTTVLLLQQQQQQQQPGPGNGKAARGELRPGLRREEDWVGVPLEVWQALSSWYGVEGPVVYRSLASEGDLRLYPGPEGEGDGEAVTSDEGEDGEEEDSVAGGTTCSAASSVASSSAAAATASSPASSALPVTKPCLACQAATSKKCSRCHKASYCCRGCQAAHWRYHKAQCADDGRPLVDLARRGRVGLLNLGNTCYMNSALQCLSHVAPLTRHFLTEAFKADLNRESPLGTGGRVAAEYSALVKEMWLGTQGACNPAALKRAVVRFAPQFMGTAQHDAHELLQFLVDALHEDLNRVREKPYIATPDYDLKRPDAEQAQEAWARSLQREDSIIVDHLWGQLKSKLVCPTCGRVSVVFDPFWTLTLELPDTNLRVLRVLVFPRPDPPAADADAMEEEEEEEEEGAGPSQQPQQQPQPRLVTVHVSRRGYVWDVKQALQAACGVRREHLYLAAVSNRKAADFLGDTCALARLPASLDALDGPAGNTRSHQQQQGRGLEVEGPDETLRLVAYEVLLLPSQPEQQPEQQQEEEQPQQQEQEEEEMEGAFLVLHHRRHRPPGARGPAPGKATAEEAGGGEDLAYELLGFPTLLLFDPRWPLRRFRAQLWRHVRPLVMVAEGDKDVDGLEETLMGALRVVQTDEMGKNLPADAASSASRGEGEEEAMETGAGGSSTGGGEEEEEEGGSMAVSDEEAEEEEEDGSVAGSASYLPLSGDDEEEELDRPVGSFLGLSQEDKVCWMALDWEGALAGRFLGMRTPGLNEDGQRALGVVQQLQGGKHELEGEGQHLPEAREVGAGGGALTLDHCLRKFSCPERLDRDNSWYCSRCKKHKQAVKTLHLWRLPRVLIVCLKRFDARDRKLDALVDFPLEGLDLSKHCRGPVDGGDGPPPVYDLFAVSNHIGSRGWGHYTACARSWDPASGRMDAQWFRYDDSLCEPVAPARVKSKEAYMLFYKRREPAGTAAKQQAGGMRACL